MHQRITYKGHIGGLLPLIHNNYAFSNNFSKETHSSQNITISLDNPNCKPTTSTMVNEKYVYIITIGRSAPHTYPTNHLNGPKKHSP